MAIAVCFVVNHREISPAVALAEWIAELGGVRDFECVLCLTKPAARLGAETQIRPILEKAFGVVSVHENRDEIEIPWPNAKNDARSPNLTFRRVSEQMEWNVKKPWLWLEMDAIPLKSSWLTELNREYESAAKPFMGVKLEVGGRPYMSGVAIYPANVTRCTDKLRNCGTYPFDVYAGIDTTRMGHFTELIQYVQPNGNGVADWSVHHEEINSKAVLFHRSKDLALIQHLRNKESGITGLNVRSFPQVEVLNTLMEPIVYSGVQRNEVIEMQAHTLTLFDFNSLTRYHVCALEGLASSPDRRKEIVGMLQISGLTHTRIEPIPATTELMKAAIFRKEPSAETKLKRVAAAAKARAAKAKKKLERTSKLAA